MVAISNMFEFGESEGFRPLLGVINILFKTSHCGSLIMKIQPDDVCISKGIALSNSYTVALYITISSMTIIIISFDRFMIRSQSSSGYTN